MKQPIMVIFKINESVEANEYSTFLGYLELVRLLIDKGADRNAITLNGETAAHIAKRKGE